MSATHTVSVVIPCYNGSNFLRETLESAINQTHTPLEIIVIDDGSTDDSAAIAESFGPPVRVIRQENQGESVARNRGIDEAQGEWIAFLDADDLWEPEKLEKQIEAANEYTAAVHTEVYFFGDQSGNSSIHMIPIQDRYDIVQIAVSNSFACPSSLIVRKGLSPKFPEWTRYAEDAIYSLELIQRGEIVLIEEPLTGYRKHSESQSASPTVEIEWHKSILEWLSLTKNIEKETQILIKKNWLKRLCSKTWILKADRNWSEYWILRNYLTDFSGNKDVDLVLQNKIFPPWCYILHDLFTGKAVR